MRRVEQLSSESGYAKTYALATAYSESLTSSPRAFVRHRICFKLIELPIGRDVIRELLKCGQLPRAK
jgi:hypothetical protein